MTLVLMLFTHSLSVETQYVKTLISISDLSINQFILLKIMIK